MKSTKSKFESRCSLEDEFDSKFWLVCGSYLWCGLWTSAARMMVVTGWRQGWLTPPVCVKCQYTVPPSDFMSESQAQEDVDRKIVTSFKCCLFSVNLVKTLFITLSEPGQGRVWLAMDPLVQSGWDRVLIVSTLNVTELCVSHWNWNIINSNIFDNEVLRKWWVSQSLLGISQTF